MFQRFLGGNAEATKEPEKRDLSTDGRLFRLLTAIRNNTHVHGANAKNIVGSIVGADGTAVLDYIDSLSESSLQDSIKLDEDTKKLLGRPEDSLTLFQCVCITITKLGADHHPRFHDILAKLFARGASVDIQYFELKFAYSHINNKSILDLWFEVRNSYGAPSIPIEVQLILTALHDGTINNHDKAKLLNASLIKPIPYLADKAADIISPTIALYRNKFIDHVVCTTLLRGAFLTQPGAPLPTTEDCFDLKVNGKLLLDFFVQVAEEHKARELTDEEVTSQLSQTAFLEVAKFFDKQPQVDLLERRLSFIRDYIKQDQQEPYLRALIGKTIQTEYDVFFYIDTSFWQHKWKLKEVFCTEMQWKPENFDEKFEETKVNLDFDNIALAVLKACSDNMLEIKNYLELEENLSEAKNKLDRATRHLQQSKASKNIDPLDQSMMAIQEHNTKALDDAVQRRSTQHITIATRHDTETTRLLATLKVPFLSHKYLELSTTLSHPNTQQTAAYLSTKSAVRGMLENNNSTIENWGAIKNTDRIELLKNFIQKENIQAIEKILKLSIDLSETKGEILNLFAQSCKSHLGHPVGLMLYIMERKPGVEMNLASIKGTPLGRAIEFIEQGEKDSAVILGAQ